MTSQASPLDFLAPQWVPFLKSEFEKPYMENLRQLLRSEAQNGHHSFPPKEHIFRALKLVDYNDVKVVILGQDPYHGAGQANGLAFAVSAGVSAPPSLVNIFKEVAQNFQTSVPRDTRLEHWARQGVLLLNTVLTVRENTAFSHRNRGWETFTDHVIQALNQKTTPVVFLLWGSAAQSKTNMLANPIHKILKAPHPSPLSAHRGFLGCRHFALANEFLREHDMSEINWLDQTAVN